MAGSTKSIFAKSLLGAAIVTGTIVTYALAADTLYRWDDRPFTDFVAGQTDTGAVDGVSLTASGTSVRSTSQTPQNGIFNGSNIDGFIGILASTLDATIDNGSVRNIINISFSEPVYNLQFTIYHY